MLRSCFLILAVSLAAASAEDAFLGSIPVQYVASGQEVVLDMHRFFQPVGKAKLDVFTKDDVDVRFDTAAFQLHVRPKKAGLSDIVLSASKTASCNPHSGSRLRRWSPGNSS